MKTHSRWKRIELKHNIEQVIIIEREEIFGKGLRLNHGIKRLGFFLHLWKYIKSFFVEA